jgi:hypothetical protein
LSYRFGLCLEVKIRGLEKILFRLGDFPSDKLLSTGFSVQIYRLEYFNFNQIKNIGLIPQ